MVVFNSEEKPKSGSQENGRGPRNCAFAQQAFQGALVAWVLGQLSRGMACGVRRLLPAWQEGRLAASLSDAVGGLVCGAFGSSLSNRDSGSRGQRWWGGEGRIPRAENGLTVSAEAITAWPSGCAGSIPWVFAGSSLHCRDTVWRPYSKALDTSLLCQYITPYIYDH